MQRWFSALNVWGTISQKFFQMWLNYQIMHYKHVAEINVFLFFNAFSLSTFWFCLSSKLCVWLRQSAGIWKHAYVMGPHSLDGCLCIQHIVWEMLVPSCFLFATLESSGKVGCTREPGFVNLPLKLHGIPFLRVSVERQSIPALRALILLSVWTEIFE